VGSVASDNIALNNRRLGEVCMILAEAVKVAGALYDDSPLGIADGTIRACR
jgi:hypothetical protein